MEQQTNRSSLLNRNHASVESIIKSITKNARYILCRQVAGLSGPDLLIAVSLALREIIIDILLDTKENLKRQNPKKVYYLSMEFLIGQSLGNNLINLGLFDLFQEALATMKIDLNELIEIEPDAALGNGGLGRLAACFLDSLASMNIPGFGYGINYEYGLFKQQFSDGHQKEQPDKWRESSSPWQIEKSNQTYAIPLYGHVEDAVDKNGDYNPMWLDWNLLIGLPYDMPVVGFGGHTVNWLRLFSATASRQFDMNIFNKGDFFRAVQQKIESETISKILYPSDVEASGKELRLIQEYFLVACALRDITYEFQEDNPSFDTFHHKVAIQLNDTHPALAIPELMRFFIDEKSIPWKKAWDITVNTFGYTNHTLLPEALEKWPMELVKKILPRHLQIIFEINRRFLDSVQLKCQKTSFDTRSMSIIEEGNVKQIRMANLAIVGSHSINGVSKLHSKLIRESLMPDFHRFWPHKFNNKTNGITPRRWLLKVNPELASLITAAIGDRWILDFSWLRKLDDFSNDSGFKETFRQIKQENKIALTKIIKKLTGIIITSESIFDVQIKRIHEYKRQLLNILHIVFRYIQIVEDGIMPAVPKTYIFAGKAAPGYQMAKQIIYFINKMGEVINNDARTKGMIKVVFLPNYRVSLAEKIIPAADISEQISTAGKEASGTGNMKLALNGALTVGTLDGANVEMQEEIGKDNIFIFGLKEHEITEMVEKENYDPREIYLSDSNIRRTIDALHSSIFSGQLTGQFNWIYDTLINQGDHYFNIADFQSYCCIQDKISVIYTDPDKWVKKSILNVAGMGKFSSDRTIGEYARDIWNIKPLIRSNID